MDDPRSANGSKFLPAEDVDLLMRWARAETAAALEALKPLLARVVAAKGDERTQLEAEYRAAAVIALSKLRERVMHRANLLSIPAPDSADGDH